MWLSTRVENVDSNVATKRGPSFSLDPFLGIHLRFGLLCEVLFLLGLNLLNYGMTGNFMYSRTAFTNESVSGYVTSLIVVCFFIGLVGALSLMIFQFLLADDACFARGYVTGSKMIRTASFLDLLSKAIGLTLALKIAGTCESSVAIKNAFINGGVEMSLLSFGQLLYGLSLLVYGFGFLLLELFQDEGVGNAYGYINLLSFVVAGTSIIIHAINMQVTGSNLLILGAFIFSFIWSLSFEPAINDFSPALEETELTNDVETQVEKFTRNNDYYNIKDQNSMIGQGSGYMQQM